MRKTFFLAAATLLLVAGSATAGPQAGQLGLGTSDVEMTPIGIRYWASEQVGIDVELGFWLFDTEPASFAQESSVIDLGLAVPINVWECSDVWLHVKPFVIIDLVSYEDIDTGSGTASVDGLTNLYFGAAFEMEAWLLECLSFSVSHGIAIIKNDGGTGGSSTTDIHSWGNSLGHAGFHLYF
jgi:hypothetical protein